jgi:hypothetical protein
MMEVVKSIFMAKEREKVAVVNADSPDGSG